MRHPLDAEKPPGATAPLVQFENVSKQFDSHSGKPDSVLKNLNLEIGQGELLSLVGPSGCGKSTLLRLLAGLESPSSGEVRFDNSFAQGEVAFVFQEASLLPWLTAEDNVALPFRITGRKPESDRIATTLKSVGIGEADFRKYPRQLSGGMKMRVSIARALILRPRLILMDEPFAALDDLLRTQLNLALMQIWQEQKLTIVFVTHNISEALFISQRIGVMQSDPGTIKDIVEVPYPYPRKKKLKSDIHFAQQFARVSALLEGAE